MYSLYKKHAFVAVVSTALVIVTIFTGLYIYNRNLTDYLYSTACNYLNETSEHQSFSLNLKIKDEMVSLDLMAQTLAYLPAQNAKEFSDKLADIRKKTRFDIVGVVGIDGVGVNNFGTVLDYSNEQFFKKALGGQTNVGNLVKSKDSNMTLLPMAAPIVKDGKVVGVVVVFYDVEKLQRLMLPIFHGEGYTYVVDAKGDFIFFPIHKNILISKNVDNPNLFKSLANIKVLQLDTLDDIVANMKQNKPGHSIWQLNDQVRNMHYKPVGINDWYVFSVATQDVIMTNTGSIRNNAMLLTFFIVAVFVLLIFYVLKQQSNQNKIKDLHAKELEKIAYYDKLTGIANLEKFELEVASMLKKNPKKVYVCLQFDIYQFKLINELFTTEIGDRVLKTLAQTIVDVEQSNTKNDFVVARVNSDKFILFSTFVGLKELDDTRNIFISSLNKKLDFLQNFKLDVRIGRYITNFGDTVEDIIQRTNFANRIAKEKDLNAFVDYVDKYKDILLAQTTIRNKMEKALENEDFKVYLQGKYRLIDETLCGAEALVRWQDDGKVIAPNQFITELERNGFIVQLDLYMFKKCCEILVSWRERNLALIPISVNFSRKHLTDSNLAIKLADIVKSYGLQTHYLEIEFTETIVLENEYILQKALKDLHEQGFLVSMDDFGTGYSSLGLLKNLDIDTVKMDRSFFVDVLKEDRAYFVVSNMINMTMDLNMETVAEGVEEKEQVDTLRRLNCDVVQGYYFCKPMPYEEFEKLLEDGDAKKKYGKIHTKPVHLRKNQELLMSAMDTMPLCFNLWDKDFNNIQCNKAAVDLFSLKDEQEYLDRFFELSPEYQPDGKKSSDKAFDMITKAFDEGYARFEWMHQNLNGEKIPAEITLVRIKNKGRVVVVGYTRDLRAQIEADEAIRLANSRMHALMDAIPLSINLWNRDLNNVFCNKSTLKMFGLNETSEFPERFFVDLSPEYQPDGQLSREKAVRFITKAFETGYASFKWLHQKTDKTPLPVEITLVRVEIEQEQLVVAYVRDMRNQIEEERLIQEANEKMQILMDATPLCINLWNKDFHNIQCNKAAVELFDLKNEQEYIDKFFDLSPLYQPDGKKSQDKAMDMITKAFDEGFVVFEWMHQKLNGEQIPSEITLVRLKLYGDDVIAGFTRDLREINSTLALNEQLTILAHFDHLTGCLSRSAFVPMLESELQKEENAKDFPLIIFDIDRFKNINDSYGHNAGDEALRRIVAEVKSVLPKDALFCRYGGDEFVIMPGKMSYDKLTELLDKIYMQIRQIEIKSETENYHFGTTISAGATYFSKDCKEASEFIYKADIALYEAKKRGRNNYIIVHLDD